MKRVSACIAVTDDWAIGYHNDLPWKDKPLKFAAFFFHRFSQDLYMSVKLFFSTFSLAYSLSPCFCLSFHLFQSIYKPEIRTAVIIPVSSSVNIFLDILGQILSI
jgi:hypothetical protein